MGRRYFNPVQIVHTPREAWITQAGGSTTCEFCRELGVVEQSSCRQCKDHGGIQVSPACKLRDLQRENTRLEAGRRTGIGQSDSPGSSDGKIQSRNGLVCDGMRDLAYVVARSAVITSGLTTS